MQRGRSREISVAAMARVAQVTTAMKPDKAPQLMTQSLASAPILTSPYTSSPSPSTSRSTSRDELWSPVNGDSETLPDHMRLMTDLHRSYARDDIVTAKMILLRLKGISVTDAQDPRIADVQPEDFDECFLPPGGLMSGKDDWNSVWEMQNREKERLRELRQQAQERVARDRKALWESEMTRKWEESKRMHRSIRVEGWKRKEEQRRLKEAEEYRRRELIRLEAVRRAAAFKPKPKAPRLSYASLSPTRASSSLSQQAEKQFSYEFMITPSLRRHQGKAPPAPLVPPLAQPLETVSAPYSRATLVPIQDVLRSLEGCLFPLTPIEEQLRHRRRSSHSRVKQHEEVLLDLLLETVRWDEGERARKKGKAKERLIPARKQSDASTTSDSTEDSHCPACSASSSSDSSSPVSRAGSWFSFGGTSSSASTSVTTPSTSVSSGSGFRSWLKSPPSRKISEHEQSVLRHSCCRRPYCSLTPIALDESPLQVHVQQARDVTANRIPPSNSNPSSHSLVKRVSRFVELAREFQNAYVGAVVFGAIPSSSIDWDANPTSFCERRRTLNDPGYRARAEDVARFMSSIEVSSDQYPSSTCIPLTSPFPSGQPPRTMLSIPLPFPIVFKPQIVPSPSPLKRFAQQANASPSTFSRATRSRSYSPLGIPSRAPSPRERAPFQRTRHIPNPMFLRLKALQNVVWERGVNWEGRAREGMLGCGKEKVLGIAYEDTGRSLLGPQSLRHQP